MLSWYWLLVVVALVSIVLALAIRRERAKYPKVAYFVRHQAAGVAHQFAFLLPPTETQVAQVVAYCRSIGHTVGHAKTPSEPYWTRIVEVPLLGAGATVWSLPEATKAKSVAEFGSHGTGMIRNPP